MKIYTTVLLGMVLTTKAWSCDVCGCAGMMMGFGDLSLYPQNKIGVSYLSRTFYSALGNSDHFTQIEINGRYVISPRWSLKASIPYLLGVKQGLENGSFTISGIGDAQAKASYIAYYGGNESSNRKLTFSGGIFLPTGKFEDHSDRMLPQNFQLGSASWDYLLEGQYQLGEGNWVGMLQAQYVINTLNPEAYKFGNQTGAQLTMAHKFGFPKWALVPLVSVSFEHFSKDVNARGYYQYGPGGQSLALIAGAQIKTRNWLWTLRGGTNLMSNQGNYRPGPQVAISTSYLFNTSQKQISNP